MASGDCENVVLVSGLPEGYRPIELEKLVGKLLQNSNALSIRIIECMNESDGTQKTQKAELHLQNQQDKSRLLGVEQIAIFFNEETHFIVFGDGNATNQQETAEDNDRADGIYADGNIFQDSASTMSSGSSKKRMTSSIDDVTVQLQQRRVYCGGMPKSMFNYGKVKLHFERFGEITHIYLPPSLKSRVLPFAKVEFKTHDMAIAAIEHHGAIQHNETYRMFVIWDKVEAQQIRQKLAKPSVQRYRKDTVVKSRASTSTNQNQRPSGLQSKTGVKPPRSSGFSDKTVEPKPLSSISSSDKLHTTEPQHDIQRTDDDRNKHDTGHLPSNSGAAPIPKPRLSLAASSKSTLNSQDKSISSSSGDSTEVKSVVSMPSSHRQNTALQSNYTRRNTNYRDHRMNRPATAPTPRQPSRLVTGFKDSPKLDTDVVHYIRKSRRQFDSLCHDLEDLAELMITDKITSRGPGFVLNYKPKFKKLPDNLKQNQKCFETTCLEISSKFFGSFVALSDTYDKVSLAAVRKSNQWIKDHDLLKVKLEDESFAEAYVRWSVKNPALVTVTGPQHDVTAMLTYMKDSCDITEESISLLKWQYRAVVECNVISEITNELKGKVSVNHLMKDDTGLVTFRGPRIFMKEARKILDNALMYVTPSPLINDEARTKFLLSSLKSENEGLNKDKVSVRQWVQGKFKRDKVHASLQLRGEEICLFYTNGEQHRRALSSLEDLVKIDLMEVSEGFEGVMASKEWKRLSQNVSATGDTQVYLNKQASTIEVVGLCYNFDKNLHRVRSHVIDNSIVTSRLVERHAVVRYLREFRGVFRDAAPYLEEVQIDYVTKDNPSIVLKGKTRNVEKAKSWFLKQFRATQVRSHVIQEPGIPRYFRDQKGKNEVEEIAKGQQSIVIVDPSELELSNGRMKVELNGENFDDNFPANVNHSSKTPGSITVNVTQGDITASKCDVIVSTTIDLSGVIGKAIVIKGGPSIAAQLVSGNVSHQSLPSRQFKSQTSNMIVTNGGNLACNYIFHIKPPDSPSVTQVLLELYKNADALGMTSFAMPAIGTGKAGLQAQHVAKCCRESIVVFAKIHPNSSLRNIEVVIFQQNLVPVFQQELALLNSQGGKSQIPVKQPSILPKQGSSVDLESVSILICSKNTESVNEVWKAIQEKIKLLSDCRTIEDEAVEELDRLEEEEILRVTKKRNVKIEKTNKNVLTISGLHTNVLETCNDVQSLIHEFKQAQTCAQFIQWKYVDPNDNVAKDFPLRTNQQLELAFKKNDKGTIELDVYMNESLVRYSFDFNKRELTCLNDNNTTNILRTNLTGEEPGFPPLWEDIGNDAWKKITLTQGREYNAILQKFQATMPNIRVVQLERIQNEALYKQFLAQKAKVESRMGVGLNVVRELFHGTASDVCDSICHNGFDRSHAGKNAIMYGKGVYFAVDARYSNGYATRDQNNHQRMFLADVVTGQYCVGNQSMIVPPMQANGSPYDSVTDNNQNPGIYVVFKDASVYPSYLLTYHQ